MMLTHYSLNALSPIDGRYADKLEALRPYLSEYGLLTHRLETEICWLKALAANKQFAALKAFNKEQNAFLDQVLANFSLDEAAKVKDIEKTTNHDVKAIEYYLKEKLAERDDLKEALEFVHFACTSEDINNIAYALMLTRSTQSVILPALEEHLRALQGFAHQCADISMLSRTHGQSASPTTLGKEFANVYARVEKQVNLLKTVSLSAKCNGAVGNFNAHHVTLPDMDWPSFSKAFIESLGLTYNAYTTQIDPHDEMATLADNIARINRIFIDLARDIWSYISLGYFKQKLKAGEVGSSTMPHKVNPIDFENAEGNFGVANALFQHFSEKLPISRWQRDLSDSTVLRNWGNAFGHTLLALKSLEKGLNKLEVNQEKIKADLNEHWEVLAEAIQTVMRYHGLDTPYEKLKALTRGEQVTQETLAKFIDEQALSDAEKNRLKALSPESYIGYAKALAKAI